MIQPDTIANIGAFGLVVWIVFYVFRSMIPKMHDEFADALRQERDTRRAQWAEYREEIRALRAVLRELTRQQTMLSALLIQHDATVRGQNPQTVGTTEELIQRAEDVVQGATSQ